MSGDDDTAVPGRGGASFSKSCSKVPARWAATVSPTAACSWAWTGRVRPELDQLSALVPSSFLLLLVRHLLLVAMHLLLIGRT